MTTEHIAHGFEPVYDSASRILILGSLPSVKSRENGFYYGHPRNRFWKVIAALVNEPVPSSIPQKRKMLLRNAIAIWDVIAECDISGSSDSSIRNVVPADITSLLDGTTIKAVFTNGSTADRIYRKYQLPLTGITAHALPSTSPANAAWSLEKLIDEWGKAILPELRKTL